MPNAAMPDPERLRAANINPVTGLATDYLNHYNEIAMMIAALADAPEMREPILEWRPVGYATHFRKTAAFDRELVVTAYDFAPPDVKARFLAARRDVELAILDVQDLVEALPEASRRVSEQAHGIFAAIARLGAVINGGESDSCADASASQALADALFS